MTVEADAEKLEVDTAERMDELVVVVALGLPVGGKTVRDICAVFIDVDMVKEIMVHEIAVALFMLRRKAAVFVEIYRADILEIQIALFIPFDQLAVHAERRRTGCKSQDRIGLLNDLGGNDISGTAAHFFISRFTVNVHDMQLLCVFNFGQRRFGRISSEIALKDGCLIFLQLQLYRSFPSLACNNRLRFYNFGLF